VARVLEELTVHTYLENEVMDPEVRRLLLPDLEQDVLESYEEHHVADVLCLELSTMDAHDERFDAKTTVLIESVGHHIDEEEKEEEEEWFPKVREALSRKALQDMGARMEQLRGKAPRLATDYHNAGARWSDDELVVDGDGPFPLINSRKPADLPAFCSELLAQLETE
jgi:hypothetical protein